MTDDETLRAIWKDAGLPDAEFARRADPVLLERVNTAPCAARDRAVEATAQTAVRGRHDQQMDILLAGARQQRRRAGQVGDAAGDGAQRSWAL